MVFGLLRIMESADNFDAGIRLIGRLFFTTCWPRIEMCGASSFMRNFLVEVFTVVKVNLDLFKGKIAGKRATLRARFIDFQVHLSVLTCTFGSCQKSYVPR